MWSLGCSNCSQRFVLVRKVDDMSLYRFFVKAGMPTRVPSLSDNEIKEANQREELARKESQQYRARTRAQAPSVGACLGGTWSSAKLFMLVSANPPNFPAIRYNVETGLLYWLHPSVQHWQFPLLNPIPRPCSQEESLVTQVQTLEL